MVEMTEEHVVMANNLATNIYGSSYPHLFCVERLTVMYTPLSFANRTKQFAITTTKRIENKV